MKLMTLDTMFSCELWRQDNLIGGVQDQVHSLSPYWQYSYIRRVLACMHLSRKYQLN